MLAEDLSEGRQDLVAGSKGFDLSATAWCSPVRRCGLAELL
jgi:hypothetical protein